jgi:hypothetical protein
MVIELVVCELQMLTPLPVRGLRTPTRPSARAFDLGGEKNRNLDPVHSSLSHSDAAFTTTHPERGESKVS